MLQKATLIQIRIQISQKNKHDHQATNCNYKALHLPEILLLCRCAAKELEQNALACTRNPHTGGESNYTACVHPRAAHTGAEGNVLGLRKKQQTRPATFIT